MRKTAPFACLLLLSACSEPAGRYRTELGMLELMAHVLDPAADAIWSAAGWEITEQGERELWPTTEEGWLAVENGAATVAEAGNLLLLPGRVPEEDGADWIRYSQQMHDVGLRAMRAAEAKNKQAVFDTGGELYQTCVACHDKYRVR